MNEYKLEHFPRPQEEDHAKAYWWRVGCELACFLVAGLILCGCASTAPESKVCSMELMGRTGDGVPVVKMDCISPEAFAKLNQ